MLFENERRNHNVSPGSYSYSDEVLEWATHMTYFNDEIYTYLRTEFKLPHKRTVRGRMDPVRRKNIEHRDAKKAAVEAAAIERLAAKKAEGGTNSSRRQDEPESKTCVGEEEVRTTTTTSSLHHEVTERDDDDDANFEGNVELDGERGSVQENIFHNDKSGTISENSTSTTVIISPEDGSNSRITSQKTEEGGKFEGLSAENNYQGDHEIDSNQTDIKTEQDLLQQALNTISENPGNDPVASSSVDREQLDLVSVGVLFDMELEGEVKVTEKHME